jgi:O-antigen/teichoic acid export membrane protein
MAASWWDSVCAAGRDRPANGRYQARHAAGQSIDQADRAREHDVRNTRLYPEVAVDDIRERQLAGLNALYSLSYSIPLPAIPAPYRESKNGPLALRLVKDTTLRGALALMLSAGASGGLGFVFWAVTAHHHDAAVVGSVSAEVSSITFLASVGSLNLISIFARFLPVAGWYARRLILTSYGGAAVAGLLAATIFLLTPLAKGLVLGGGFGQVGFAACVILNSIFNIQDGGLIGFRQFGWVPVENILVALIRLALLFLAAMFLSAQIGILWSWALPMAAAVLVVNVMVVGPLAGHAAKRRPKLPTVGEMGRFVAVGSVSSAASAAISAFLPALVTQRLGTIEGGYFYVPWIIGTMVTLLLNNISISMVREVVGNPGKADFTVRRSMGLAALLVTVVMAVCLLLGRLVLAPLGPKFVLYGAPLLHWVGLAVPATAVIVLFLAVCLVRQRPWPALALNLATSIAIVGGILLLGSAASVSRVGIVYCITQWVAAAAVSLPTFRGLRIVHQGREL